MDEKLNLRWGVERKLEFIEFRLFWEGYVNRGDIIDTFNVSVNQASTDLNRYLGLAPDNMSYDSIRPEKQAENLGAIAQSCEGIGISFTWEFDQTNTIHARHIVTDTGWKIALDRGLDIFQQYELNDAFSFANRLQQFRSVKAFEVIYLRTSKAD